MKIKSGIIILLCFFSFFSCRSAGEKTSGYDLKVYPQLGHSDIISTIIFTPDNRYVVSGALDTTVKVWDIYTGREKETFFGHTGLIRALAVSPCGSLIASSAQDGVRVWDFKTGKEIAMFNEEAVSLFFSPDELMLYTASANGIKIWDIKKRKVVKTITAENVSMASAGSNDNIAYNSDSLIIYNTNTGSKKTFNNDFITSVFLSSDDRYLAGGSRDGAILFWDLNGTGYERISAHVRRINSVAISGNSRFLASASDDNTVVLFDLFNERRRKNLTGHTDNVNAVAFSPDSRFMATASSDKTIKIWDTAGGEEIRTISANYDVPVLSVISKDEQFIATFTNNNFLRLWNAKTGQLIDSFKINDKISSIAFSHDNDSIITVSPDGYVRFYVIKTGKSNTQNPISGYEAALAQSFSPCGSFVAAALWDGNIRIWNYLLESKLDYELNDSVLVTAISFCSENLSAIIGFSNGKVSIMDLQTKKIKVLARHKDTIAAVQFNHDGTKLVYGTESGEIHIINTKNGRRLAPVLRHQFKITSLSFSADDKKIVSGALDNTVV
ncbi:MAG: WD40 repeat domain-containing protein, partial [Treponema sp.]|nr:WD40 repeat domain-containing protein [Treponema sp.]